MEHTNGCLAEWQTRVTCYNRFMGRPRSWTDEQLQEAVEVSRSWGSVLRHMGLSVSGATMKLVAGRSLYLGLDTAHLPEVKTSNSVEPCHQKFSLQEMKVMVSQSTCWSDLRSKMGRHGGSSHAYVKRIVDDLDLDISHFRSRTETRVVSPSTSTRKEFVNSPSPNNLRFSATAIATEWFMRRGYTVSLPVEPAKYDLVVDSDSGLRKVQVKSTNGKHSNGRWSVRIAHHPYDSSTVSGRSSPVPYTSSEVDYFFIVCGDGSMYLVPISDTGGVTNLTLDVKYSQFKV